MMRKLLLLLTFALAAIVASYGQKYDFRQFGPSSGLPDNVVYSVSQDVRGFLWVGTGTGLYRFDGFVFRKVEYPDNSALRFATAMHRDSNNRLWIGTSDGTLYYSSGSELVHVEGVSGQRINDITDSPGDGLYVVTQNNGIFSVTGERTPEVRHLVQPRGMLLYSIAFTSDGTLFAGTQENLVTLAIRGDSLTTERVVGGIEYIKVGSLVPTADRSGVLAGTEDFGLFYCSTGEEGYVAQRVLSGDEFDYLRIQSLNNDRDGNLWVATTGAGVYKLYLDQTGLKVSNIRHYNSLSGLPGDDARSVFQDNEGNVWIALYGNGLSQLVSEAFTSYRPGTINETNNIVFVGQKKGEYILGTPSGYHIFDLFSGRSLRFESLSVVTAGIPATSYHIDSNSAIWIGTAGGGLFVKREGENARLFFKTGNAGENNINSVTTKGNEVWLSTRNGIIVLDNRTGAVLETFTTLNKLPHNNINQVFIDRSGKSLVATEASVIYEADLGRGVISGDVSISGSIKNIMQGFTQSADGGYWIATTGNGVFYIAGDSVIAINSANGLLSNFCYSILADSDNRLWVGHERGYSRYDIARQTMAVYTTTFAGGGDCNPNAIFESSEGMVLIGTTNGVIVYDRTRDIKGVVAPANNILSVTINEDVYNWQPVYTLPFNKYLVKIEFAGISLSNPQLVRYRTFLKNYDNEWSEYSSDRQVSYRLPDGSFQFSLETVNEAGVASLIENAFTIIVKKPVWRRWWFVLLILIAISGIVVVIVRLREANQLKMRLMLEKELKERTREVVRQKEEIELQNTEITDSINYARRIQSSILPDVTRLKENFRDAFIVFIPRDIVSGDFYWFDKLDDDRFLVVCADSTGHGVPGAFMSMIGSTLIQDIVTRKSVTRPSEILSMLDKLIFSTLNRNLEVGVSNDGMDMVVCEFNMKTRHVRFASAMRPVIIIMGGEPVYIKGNRSSVGGMSYSEKFFDDQEYYLADGDAVYLFSDGFPDQFGGEDGKKMKVARLKKLIESLVDMPMEKQKDYITNFFYDWKGNYEQVDDILFMGIRM
jgi:ligand-binding sensor domain-containing protein/serine phosphatase RsbU (regulator of sigma subunit)